MTKPTHRGRKAKEANVTEKAKHSDNNNKNKEEKEEEEEEEEGQEKDTTHHVEGENDDDANATKPGTKNRKSTPTRVTMWKKDHASPEIVKNDNLDFEEDEAKEGPKVEEKTPAGKKKRATKQVKKETTIDSKAHRGTLTNSDDNNEQTREDEDLAACCLCHCALDYSDRVAFFEADRLKEIQENKDNNSSSDDDGESLYFQPTDPYVPKSLYDPLNALVYCDGGCNRLYHQKCHFVPLMVVPRGKWTCLICATASKVTKTNNNDDSGRSKKKQQQQQQQQATQKENHAALFTKRQLKQLFQSPPPPAKLQLLMSATDDKDRVYHTKAEREWEIATGRDKAILWHKTLVQVLPSWIQSQMSNLSQAQTALDTLTRTKQNRQHFLENKASKRGSQELAQTLVKLAGAKWKMRQMILNLEGIRVNPERHIWLIQQWCRQGVITDDTPKGSDAVETGDKIETEASADTTTSKGPMKVTTSRPPPKSFVDRVIFPFGQHPPRMIPRTPEMLDSDEGDGEVPTKIVTKQDDSNKSNEKDKDKKKEVPPKKSSLVKVAKADDDSGVSLEDLKCCVCLIGDASDENDLLMCDAQGCFRAFHMNCLEPRMTLKDVEGTEDEDWFCPLCSNLANCMHTIQSYYMGEDWDQRRRERAIAQPKKQKAAKGKEGIKSADKHDNDDDLDGTEDDDSLKSWAQPDDVFPDSKWEYETALQLKAGERSEDTDALLEQYLGEAESDRGGTRVVDYTSDGSGDEELFDLEAFHEQRRRQYEDMEESDDDTTHSSQATLVDMSSVELKIGKDELNALSEASDSDSGDEDDGSESEDEGHGSESGGEGRRRRYRLRRRQTPTTDLAKNVGVDFDISNIVEGKRRRKPVDYRKLNDALFGDLDENEIAKLDDKEDFQVPIPKKKVTPSSSSGDEASSSDSDNDNNDSDDADEAKGSSENEESNAESKEKEITDVTLSTTRGAKGKKQDSKKRKRSSKESKDDDSDSGNVAGNEDSPSESAQKKKKKSSVTPSKAKKPSSRGATNQAVSRVTKVNGAKAKSSYKTEIGGKSKKPKDAEAKDKKALKAPNKKPKKNIASAKTTNGSKRKQKEGRGAKKNQK